MAEEAIPKFAVCFRIDDREDIHLLEVADDVAELADGLTTTLMGTDPNGELNSSRLLTPFSRSGLCS
jgi:hypothetical protein